MMKPDRTRLIARPFLFFYISGCGVAWRDVTSGFVICPPSALKFQTAQVCPPDRTHLFSCLMTEVASCVYKSRLCLNKSPSCRKKSRTCQAYSSPQLAHVYIRNLPFRKIVQTFIKDCFALVFRYFVHERWEQEAFIVLVGRLFP